MLINTNISAQNAALLLTQSSQQLSKSLARLSSGSKITSPADDAAGLAVSMNFSAQIDRTDAANNNIANTQSFSQTQDGYLQQIGNALDRMSELAVQAQDVTKSDSDRTLYNQEFQTLSNFISDVQTKDFNGVSLFSGNALNVTTDAEGGTFSMQGISANYVTPGVTTMTTVGDAADTQLGTLSSSLVSGSSGLLFTDGGAYHRQFTTSDTINDLVNWINTDPGGDSASYDSSTGQLSITTAPNDFVDDWDPTESNPGQMLSDLGFTPTSADYFNRTRYGDDSSGSSYMFTTTLTHQVTTTTSAMDVSTTQDAADALTQIKSAITQLASDRATVGANMERLTLTSQELSTLKNNLSAANSRIMDVDVAQESTNYAKENILVQTGTSMLAQANSQPQSVLKLLG